MMKLLTPSRSKSSKSSYLVFNGLDTFTTIEICGQIIGTTDNQFRQYTFDISKAINKCKGVPTLALNFGSAPDIVNKIAEDPNTRGIRTITISYTFFRSLDDAARSGALANAGQHVGPARMATP